MKIKKIEIIMLICIYAIIFIDILLSGILLDLIAVLLGVALYLFSRQREQFKNIFFQSAIIFFIIAIVFYCLNAQFLPYNSAANWTYLFFLFGVLKMILDQIFEKKHL